MAIHFFSERIAIRAVRLEVKKMSRDEVERDQEPRLLPVAKVDGREFLVDIENRLFRNFTSRDEVIEMHSEQGRKMVKDMQGSAWKSYGVSTGTIKKAEV